MMTRKTEKELEAKGYHIKTGFGYSESDAKKYADELRAKGYYARVAEYSTMVKGLHNFAVWYKER